MIEPNLVIKKLRVIDSKVFCQTYKKFIGVTFLRKKIYENLWQNILAK